MSLVEIKFSADMALAAMEGRKICTSRHDQKGEIGDTFFVVHPETRNIGAFRIVDVDFLELREIGNKLYRKEGCSSREEFISLWKRLHRGHYSPDNKYFVHWFSRVVGEIR